VCFIIDEQIQRIRLLSRPGVFPLRRDEQTKKIKFYLTWNPALAGPNLMRGVPIFQPVLSTSLRSWAGCNNVVRGKNKFKGCDNAFLNFSMDETSLSIKGSGVKTGGGKMRYMME
jgi:hypothetical protein